jgi:putative hydrolase of the HAD superfamily
MKNIKAVGFDLFNTLITVSPECVTEAMVRLTDTLRGGGIDIEFESFRRAHRSAAVHFFREAKAEGRETHNRFWISRALTEFGCTLEPDDPLISRGVDAYFSSFFEYSRLIPGTIEMLKSLRGSYRLGLLSNFTHAPAADALLEQLGLPGFFDHVVISGRVGYCKPDRRVFSLFLEGMGVEGDEVAFVGDDPDADVKGAADAGLKPVWTTYVMDNNLPHAVSVVAGSQEDPGNDFPRISCWEDLFSLLGKRPPERGMS